MTESQNALKSYLSNAKFFPINSIPDHSVFCNEDLNLISLSNILHEISVWNKKYEEVSFSEDLLNQMQSHEKRALFNNIVFLHKELFHFIIKNKDLDVSS
jgi:hypothetical protein